jgi:hypothetical protein
MPAIEELEHRVARLESLFEDVLKERMNLIAARLDQIYEKTERDKTELLEKIGNLYAKTEKDKAELLEKIGNLYTKTEKDKAEILVKTERDKREIIKWMIGLLIGFSTIIITAIGVIITLALR